MDSIFQSFQMIFLRSLRHRLLLPSA
ncbi:MAG: hypothetical protein LBR68_06620 [Lachnoclostridium sp.]|nr:hypothetical protein [Lachnoclostridium sp.]